MEFALKKRRVEPNRSVPSKVLVDKGSADLQESRGVSTKGDPNVQKATNVAVAQSQQEGCLELRGVPTKLDPNIQRAKKFAVAQAQQEGCLGNYRSFDSPFGNYLVPVIPTRADLLG